MDNLFIRGAWPQFIYWALTFLLLCSSRVTAQERDPRGMHPFPWDWPRKDAPEPRGATYEDEIERYRREMRERRAQPPPPPPPAPTDPFQRWEGPAPAEEKVEIHVDAAFTQQDLFYWRDGQEYRYGTFKDLQNRYLALPPPPVPLPITRISQIWQNNPPTNVIPLYDPLLQFLQSGPGPSGVGTVGNLITVTQLQQITPSLLALAPLLRQLQSGTLTLNQLVFSPQGAAFLSVAQSILQPIGLWNSATLYAWANYLAPSFRQQNLISILTTLESALLAALNLPPGQLVTITNTYQPPSINPYAVINEMNELWKKKDQAAIAARYPALAHSLIQHLGFTRPQGLLYGNRQGRKNSIFPYNVGIITEQRTSDSRQVWVLNESGFFINETASGVGRYYQGPDDLSLVYVPFEVNESGHVNTLDVRASHDYTLYKRAVGGDIDIINRASTDSTGLLHVDIPVLDGHLHLRPFAGTTPYATTAGAMLRVDYGTQELFTGHVGLGAGYRQMLYSAGRDDWINYLETENVFRTTYLTISSPDNTTGFRLWPSVTIAASGLMTTPVGPDDENRWTLQAEARFIPELHAQLATKYALFTISGGATSAIVPGGDLDLKNPERMLGFYPIRTHIEFTCRIKFSDVLVEPSPYYLELGGVTEFSELVDTARAGARFGTGLFHFDWLTEVERYHDSSFTDIRMGGGFGLCGVDVVFLQSLKDNDYRAQASIDVLALIDLQETLPSRGLLDSYGN